MSREDMAALIDEAKYRLLQAIHNLNLAMELAKQAGNDELYNKIRDEFIQVNYVDSRLSKIK